MKILAIASLTLREALRKKIVLAGVVLTLLFLALYATGVHFAMASLSQSGVQGHTPGGLAGARAFVEFQAAMFLFMGLFVANMIGALVAVFSACGAVSGELEQGTLQSLAARPIRRSHLILGKWLGYSAMLALYVGALFSLLILIVYSQSGWSPPNVTLAGLAFIAGAIVILSAALFGSVLLPTAANAVVILMLFMTALVGGLMEQIGVLIGKETLFTTGVVSSLIMPTDALYRYSIHLLQPPLNPASAFMPQGAASMGPFGSASPPSAWMLVYALLFTIVLLNAAIAAFSKRDL